ncbi:MAG: ribonuclease HII [Candidatus Thorarchaeota archaeon]
MSMRSALHGTAGIDEAGRGPMIGPMIVCGLRFDSDPHEVLNALGVRDSKQLSSKRRESIFSAILSACSKSEVRTITARVIDAERERGTSLNEIELREFVHITQALRPSVVYVDAADVKADRFGERILQRSGLAEEGLRVISEHRADLTYPIVSAASVVAKVTRDWIIEEYHAEFGDFGSGYPSDPKTVSFVKSLIVEGNKMPSIVRRSWESVKRLVRDYQTEQTRLDSF